MFGYIRPYENELRVRNLKFYRCIYCGLCKSAAKHCGIFSRFFLSYDYTLFAAVRMIFEKTPYTFTKKRCGFHLFAKKDIVADNNVLALSSAIFSIMTYYKINDNIKDEGFFKALGARLLLPVASHMRKKAIKNGYADTEAIISDCMERISLLEKSENPSSLEMSEAFGDMMGYLLKLGLSEEDKEDAFTVGFETGKFIYNADALDDLEKDEKSGNFNPYLSEYKNAASALENAKKQRITFIRNTDSAADIISTRIKTSDQNIRELGEIVQNIFYLGCPAVIDGILSKDNCRSCRKQSCTDKRKEKNK